MIAEWIHEVIDGCGGLHDFERCEIAVPNIPRDEAVASFVIKALANPECNGSAGVLDAIMNRRAELEAHS